MSADQNDRNQTTVPPDDGRTEPKPESPLVICPKCGIPSYRCECADQPARSQTTRSDVDYAIEFGRYLATAAEHFMAEQNRAWEAEEAPDSEYWSRLESAIYEFRKRADRAEATTKLVRRLAAQQRLRKSA